MAYFSKILKNKLNSDSENFSICHIKQATSPLTKKINNEFSISSSLKNTAPSAYCEDYAQCFFRYCFDIVHKEAKNNLSSVSLTHYLSIVHNNLS